MLVSCKIVPLIVSFLSLGSTSYFVKPIYVSLPNKQTPMPLPALTHDAFSSHIAKNVGGQGTSVSHHQVGDPAVRSRSPLRSVLIPDLVHACTSFRVHNLPSHTPNDYNDLLQACGIRTCSCCCVHSPSSNLFTSSLVCTPCRQHTPATPAHVHPRSCP